MKSVYLDHASTTKVDMAVFKKMAPFLLDNFGNPSSLHSVGRVAKVAMEKARTDVAKILRANPQEIIFAGSGTESDNLALSGVAHKYKKYGNHIIVSKIEHKAILESAKKLEKEGFKISYIDVDRYGFVNISRLKKLLRPGTILISIMYANNEIGTIQPIAEISNIIRLFRKNNAVPFFHTDACQACGYLSTNIKKLGVDLISFNGSKIYGPKGVGILYVNKQISIEPALCGGGQENGKRSGTENVAAIIGFAEAFKLADKQRHEICRKTLRLRDYFIKKISGIQGVTLIGHPKKRLPNNISLIFDDIEGESLVLMLDNKGIYVSTGSACSSDDLNPSHVLIAIGIPAEKAHGSLRITLGKNTNKKDLDYVLKELPPIVNKLRKISSLNIK